MEKELELLSLKSQKTFDKQNIWIDNEQKLHQNSLFFGECLDEEIDTVLTQLIETYEENQGFKLYVKILREKLEFLKKFQKAVENKLEKEQMTS